METHELAAAAAQNIAAILEARAMTQKGLADAAGMYASELSRLLGAAKPGNTEVKTSLITLTKIATALDVRVVELLAKGFWMLLRGTVAAGPFDRPTVYDEPKTIFVPRRHPVGCFALTVTGRSCTRWGICDGDVVIIAPATNPVEARFNVVRNSDGFTLKAYHGGELWQFRPEDEVPVMVEMDLGTEVVGVVIGGEYGERIYKPSPTRRKKRN